MCELIAYDGELFVGECMWMLKVIFLLNNLISTDTLKVSQRLIWGIYFINVFMTHICGDQLTLNNRV